MPCHPHFSLNYSTISLYSRNFACSHQPQCPYCHFPKPGIINNNDGNDEKNPKVLDLTVFFDNPTPQPHSNRPNHYTTTPPSKSLVENGESTSQYTSVLNGTTESKSPSNLMAGNISIKNINPTKTNDGREITHHPHSRPPISRSSSHRGLQPGSNKLLANSVDNHNDENHWVPYHGKSITRNNHRGDECDDSMSTLLPTKEPYFIRVGTKFCSKL